VMSKPDRASFSWKNQTLNYMTRFRMLARTRLWLGVGALGGARILPARDEFVCGVRRSEHARDCNENGCENLKVVRRRTHAGACEKGCCKFQPARLDCRLKLQSGVARKALPGSGASPRRTRTPGGRNCAGRNLSRLRSRSPR
jgi:hypothetical protein